MIKIHGRAVPTELTELASPSETCLVVIDMQNDLCADDGAFAQRGADLSGYRRIREPLARLIRGARDAGVLVVFIRVTTRPDHATQSLAQLYFEWRIRSNYPEGDNDLKYCLAGTWGHDVLLELDCRPDDVVIDKYRSSAFAGTPLDLILRSNEIRTVIATGCTTEGCVDSTVRDAGFLDYFTIVPRDCVASDIPALHDAAMTILEAYRTIVVDSDQLLATWKPSQDPTG